MPNVVTPFPGTIVFRMAPSRGTDRTIHYCRSGVWKDNGNLHSGKRIQHRPVLVIGSLEDEEKAKEEIMQFLRDRALKSVNIAGHRSGASGGVVNFDSLVEEILYDCFVKLRTTSV